LWVTVCDRGYELIVGSSIDRQFGPVILFGAGGIMVEVFKDNSLALPPLNRTLARRQIERTKIAQALAGQRGQQPVDRTALEALLVRFSNLVADFPDIAEIDINPLLASAGGVVALDARAVLAPADLPEASRPRLAIYPYPSQYTKTHRLADGAEVLVRAIRPEDEPLIVELHEGLSEQTIRRRFFGMVRRLSRDSLIRLCHLDYGRALALAATHPGPDGRPRIIGVSRYQLHAESREAEFAVVVTDAWQGRGVGWLLMRQLIDAARERGARRIVGDVLAENAPMLRLMKDLRFEIRPTADAGVVRAVMDLGAV
jgi:acetyltransferase